MKFNEALQYGKIAESKTAKWLIGKGFSIMPVYEKEQGENKGPQLFTPKGDFALPDLFVFRDNKTRWIEVKRKNAFSWHRITQKWVTGIDKNLYDQYLEIQKYIGTPVSLLFLQEGGGAKDSPDQSPDGLYGNSLDYLKEHINHTHDNWGKHGMVYWAIEHLKLYATIDEINIPPASSDISFEVRLK